MAVVNVVSMTETLPSIEIVPIPSWHFPPGVRIPSGTTNDVAEAGSFISRWADDFNGSSSIVYPATPVTGAQVIFRFLAETFRPSFSGETNAVVGGSWWVSLALSLNWAPEAAAPHEGIFAFRKRFSSARRHRSAREIRSGTVACPMAARRRREIDNRAAVGGKDCEFRESIIAGDSFKHGFHVAIRGILFEAGAGRVK